jgi:hypothetical protein
MFLEVFSNINANHWFLRLFFTILEELTPISWLFFCLLGRGIGGNPSPERH